MFSKKPICPITQITYHFSPFQEIRKAKGIQEAVPTKKKEKRTLETFSEKPTRPIPRFTYHSKRSKRPKGPRRRSYKKERKENVRNVLREAHLLNPKVHLPFQEIRRSKRSNFKSRNP